MGVTNHWFCLLPVHFYMSHSGPLLTFELTESLLDHLLIVTTFFIYIRHAVLILCCFNHLFTCFYGSLSLLDCFMAVILPELHIEIYIMADTDKI